MQNTTSPYKRSQSLSRGLALLQALSVMAKGTATISELSRVTTLHRTTVKRLLHTLIADGYVTQSLSDNSYRLSYRVRQLSEGFTDDEWISEVAAPTIGQLLQHTLWPSDLCTLSGSTMIIRETTHRFSSLSFHRSMIRQHLPLLTTAAGRAYFCFCPEHEQHQLLELIKTDSSSQAHLAHDALFIEQLITKTQSQGYASNEGDWDKENNTAAIALPVFHQQKILSTINLVFLKKVLTPQQAADKYLPYLQEAIQTIEKELAQRNTTPFN